MLQLTYGDRWAEAVAHFRALGELLPARLEAYLRGAAAPAAFAGAVAGFPDATAAATEEWQHRGDFWANHPAWAALLDPAASDLHEAILQLVHRREKEQETAVPPFVEDYLRGFLGVVGGSTVDLVYRLLGLLGTERARQLLLTELERRGRHLHTTGLLRGLLPYRDPDTRDRLLALYASKGFTDNQLHLYLRLLENFHDPAVEALALDILRGNPYDVGKIANVLGANGYTPADVARVAREQFLREENYFALDHLLGFVNGLGVEDTAIDLTAMNLRAAAPEFVDVPPVNWPQQLEPNWRRLLPDRPREEVFALLNNYLERPEPRLQRNALLQLEAYLERLDYAPRLPRRTEERLRELLDSRLDKVSAVALRTVGKTKTAFREPEALLGAILRHSLRTNYRMVVLAALRNVGDSEAGRAQTREFFRRAIATADDPTRGTIRRLLPFVGKYLGDASELKEQLRAATGS